MKTEGWCLKAWLSALCRQSRQQSPPPSFLWNGYSTNLAYCQSSVALPRQPLLLAFGPSANPHASYTIKTSLCTLLLCSNQAGGKFWKGMFTRQNQRPHHFLFIRHRDLVKSACCSFFGKRKRHTDGFWEFWLYFSFFFAPHEYELIKFWNRYALEGERSVKVSHC